MLFGTAGCATCPSPSADAVRMYADGLSLHQYVGSDPVGQGDPRGLFFTLPDILSDSFAIGQDAANQAAMKYYEDQATGFVGQIQAAAFDDLYDMDWALDWSQKDFDYSRSGVAAESYGYRAAPCLDEEEAEPQWDGGGFTPSIKGRGAPHALAARSGCSGGAKPRVNPNIHTVKPLKGNSHASQKTT